MIVITIVVVVVIAVVAVLNLHGLKALDSRTANDFSTLTSHQDGSDEKNDAETPPKFCSLDSHNCPSSCSFQGLSFQVLLIQFRSSKRQVGNPGLNSAPDKPLL